LLPKILIDTVTLLSQKTGIGRYTYEVAKNLRVLSNYEYTYFHGFYSKKLDLSWIKILKPLKSMLSKIGFLKSLIKKTAAGASSASANSFDIYWQPNFVPNVGIKADKTIATIHDFSWLHYPEFQPKERVAYLRKNLLNNSSAIDHIITGSNYTKQEIVDILGVDERMVSVIYHGIDHKIFFKSDADDKDDSLPKKYILSVGSIEPRKNLKNLILAYNGLDAELKSQYKLLLVGYKGWNNSEIKEMIEKSHGDVSYLGYVDDKKLAQLYNNVSLFVYPSFYEGFGIPPLEAMACGTPVIVSERSSIPEVCGDAAVYINPDSSEQISQEMSKILRNTHLQEQMIQKGLERAALFSWEESARQHLEVFKKVLHR
jgi:glycosyltransferase involved in cell wall biosynthesis